MDIGQVLEMLATDPGVVPDMEAWERQTRHEILLSEEPGYVDDVILPRETRKQLMTALNLLKTKRDQNPPKKHGNIPL